MTPDGQTLVALTQQDFGIADVQGTSRTPQQNEHAVGALHLWNLRDGAHRTIDLPEQPPGAPVTSWVDGRPAPWTTQPHRFPLRGCWFQGEHSANSTTMLASTANLLVNLDTSQFRRGKDDADELVELELSPSGRLYFENRARQHGTCQWRVLESDTERELLTYEHADVPQFWAFSPSERYFAISMGGDTSPHGDDRLQIWQIEPARLLHEFTGNYPLLAFSPNGERLGALHEEDKQRWEPISALVFDVATGARTHECPLSPSHSVFVSRDSTLWFTDDGGWLLLADDLSNCIEAGEANQPRVKMSLCWNLRTNAVVKPLGERWDLRAIPFGHVQAEPPRVVCDNENRLYEIPSGRACGSFSEQTRSIIATRDGRILVRYDDQAESRFSLTDILDFARDCGVPISQSFWLQAYRWGQRSAWLVFEPVTGRILARMPEQRPTHWLSPDERTLVTLPCADTAAIHIWDFPPHPPIVAPLAWSWIVLGLVLVGWGFRASPASDQ